MLATLLLMLSGYALSSPSAGDADYCVRPSITIEAEPADRRVICDGVEDALAFFGRLGLDLSHPLAIEATLDLPDELSANVVGCYKEEERTVFVLPFSALEGREAGFEVPVGSDLYRSLVTHEVAHAIAGCNFAISRPTAHAHEYLAYVAMLATMNPVVRAQIMATKPGTGFQDLSEINELTYAFDPARFGIEAYRHYLKKDNGDDFLLKVLSGEVLTNTIHDLP